MHIATACKVITTNTGDRQFAPEKKPKMDTNSTLSVLVLVRCGIRLDGETIDA